MQNTTNYNFNLPEGTDLWNYLTQTNPNFTALDSILKGVSDATVTTAIEVASGTAHAISRTLPDANVIRFTATSNWTLGDTMTIDGTPVTVVKPNGTNLQTGDYVIGSEVLGVIRATQFTVYVGGPSSLDAVDVDYDNTVSGLTATDVQAAIDEEASAIATINSKLIKEISGNNATDLNTFITGLTEKQFYSLVLICNNAYALRGVYYSLRLCVYFDSTSNTADIYRMYSYDTTNGYMFSDKKLNGSLVTTQNTITSWKAFYSD